jgi:FtsH-binding integral membrane protein
MNEPFNRQNRSITGDSPYAASAAGFDIPLAVADRGTFIIRTYAHLFAAILAFIALEAAWFSSGLADTLTQAMVGRTSWLLVLGGFIVTSWLATRVAFTATSLAAQYLGLAGYVVAESIIFVPILYIADRFAPGTIASAAVATGLGFLGLTMVAFGTRKDFSFLRGILCWTGVCALLAILASLAFGFNLGTWFSVGMVAVAGASILYDTSNVLLKYPEDRYVGAALQLFASVALMFWYILRMFLASRR